jgi:hypothetical protein
LALSNVAFANHVNSPVGPVAFANVAITDRSVAKTNMPFANSVESPVKPLAFANMVFINSVDSPDGLVAFTNVAFSVAEEVTFILLPPPP